MGIKKTKYNKGREIISPSPEIAALRSILDNHPVFCFQFLHRGFTINECTDEEKALFIKRICDLSAFKWSFIQTAPNDGIGSEKIRYSSIRVGKPNHITKETEFLAFRFGNCRRFIGYRDDFIFHVIYIDPHLQAYKH